VRPYWEAHYADRRWFGQAGHYQTRWERRRAGIRARIIGWLQTRRQARRLDFGGAA
jgi:hypothetical protein